MTGGVSNFYNMKLHPLLSTGTVCTRICKMLFFFVLSWEYILNIDVELKYFEILLKTMMTPVQCVWWEYFPEMHNSISVHIWHVLEKWSGFSKGKTLTSKVGRSHRYSVFLTIWVTLILKRVKKNTKRNKWNMKTPISQKLLQKFQV